MIKPRKFTSASGPVFKTALKTACGIAFNALPVMEGGSAEEQDYVRELLQLAVIDYLLGPAGGPRSGDVMI